jgi:hypothetical protein
MARNPTAMKNEINEIALRIFEYFMKGIIF